MRKFWGTQAFKIEEEEEENNNEINSGQEMWEESKESEIRFQGEESVSRKSVSQNVVLSFIYFLLCCLTSQVYLWVLSININYLTSYFLLILHSFISLFSSFCFNSFNLQL